MSAVERNALGLQVAIIGADQRGELRSGGMAHDEEALRIAAVLGDVVVDPAERLRHVADDGLHVDVRQQSIVGGDEDEPLVREHLRLDLHAALVARLPAAAVNPEDDRQVLRAWRGIDIEHLPFRRRAGIGDVAFDLLSLRGQSERDDEEQRECAVHGSGPCGGGENRIGDPARIVPRGVRRAKLADAQTHTSHSGSQWIYLRFLCYLLFNPSRHHRSPPPNPLCSLASESSVHTLPRCPYFLSPSEP